MAEAKPYIVILRQGTYRRAEGSDKLEILWHEYTERCVIWAYDANDAVTTAELPRVEPRRYASVRRAESVRPPVGQAELDEVASWARRDAETAHVR